MSSLVLGANATDRAENLSTTGTLDLVQKTYLVWHFPTSIVASTNILTGRGAATGNGPSLKFSNDTSGNLRLFENGGTNLNCITSTTPCVTLNKWYYTAADLDFGGTPLIYNGDLTTNAASQALGTNTVGASKTTEGVGTITLGGQQPSHATPYLGNIALAAIYNRKLSSTEIIQHQYRWAALSGCVGLYYPGLNGGLSTIKDYSGQGNDLTISGCSLGADIPLLGLLAHVNGIPPMALKRASLW